MQLRFAFWSFDYTFRQCLAYTSQLKKCLPFGLHLQNDLSSPLKCFKHKGILTLKYCKPYVNFDEIFVIMKCLLYTSPIGCYILLMRHDFNWAYIAFKSKIYLYASFISLYALYFLEFGLLYNIKFDHFCSSNTMLAKIRYVFLFTLHLFSGLK